MSSFRKFASGRTWVVTGAASGIGLEMVKMLMASQAVVWALDLDAEKLQELEREAKRTGGSLFTLRLNVADVDAVRDAIARILRESKRIDVWINNAGIQKVGSLVEQDPKLFDAVMRVNFGAVVDICRMLVKIMESQGEGVILNMASVAGHVPAPFMTAYVASKHAVVGFTRALRAELALLKSPVRCVMASPGFVDTAIIEKGAHSGFPQWLSWLLAKPESCAREILEGLADGKDEVEPTLNGRAMSMAFRLVPQLTVKSSRVLLTRSLSDVFFNRYNIPRA